MGWLIEVLLQCARNLLDVLGQPDERGRGVWPLLATLLLTAVFCSWLLWSHR